MTASESTSSIESEVCVDGNRLFECFFLFLRCDVTSVNESSVEFESIVMLKINEIEKKNVKIKI